MRRYFFITLTAATSLLWLVPLMGLAQTPKRQVVREIVRDLTVELRQVKYGEQDNPDAPGNAYTAGTANRAVDFAPQQVRVRNGEKASLQINQSMPMQWVQKVESQSATLSAASASASSNAGGVTQAITWMESGQGFVVTPRWKGGSQPVTLEIEVQSSAVDERTSPDLPATSRQRYSTTVTAPLNQWVTIATSGRTTRSTIYNSMGTSDARRLIQIRVMAE